MSRAAAEQVPTGTEKTGRKLLLHPGLLSARQETRIAGIRRMCVSRDGAKRNQGITADTMSRAAAEQKQGVKGMWGTGGIPWKTMV